MAEKPTATKVLLRPEGVVVRGSSNLLHIDAPEVIAAVRFIRENTHRTLKVADILEVVPVSRRYLEQRFRTILGRTINDEIRRQRLRQARERLITTQEPVAEVARESGFESLDHFYRSFREEFGETPGDCRKAFQI
jgi:LacI family transcriptional regulator